MNFLHLGQLIFRALDKSMKTWTSKLKFINKLKFPQDPQSYLFRFIDKRVMVAFTLFSCKNPSRRLYYYCTGWGQSWWWVFFPFLSFGLSLGVRPCPKLRKRSPHYHQFCAGRLISQRPAWKKNLTKFNTVIFLNVLILI